MVDQPKLDELLSKLKTYVESLRRLALVPREQLLADPDKLGSAKYHFIVAIECCLDIAHHVIASEKLRIPRDTADSFVVLVERGICGRQLEEPLKAMARFRNRLVHLYWDVDERLVADYLRESLGDFDRFAAAVDAAGRQTRPEKPCHVLLPGRNIGLGWSFWAICEAAEPTVGRGIPRQALSFSAPAP